MIDILMCGDSNVFKGVCLNTLSILKYTKEEIRLHLMTMEVDWSKSKKISEENASKLRDVMKEKNPLNELIYYDTSSYFEEVFSKSRNKDPKYTPGSLLRLICPKYLNCDKVLYLDTDMLTFNSLSIFHSINMEDKEIAVVKDYMGRFWIKRDYFNSGMLYINLKECKKTKLFERAIELLETKKYYFSDQTALYKASTKRVYLPFIFNEQRKVKTNTVIKHFCKAIQYIPYFKVYNIKPWHVDKMHSFLHMYMFDDILKEYEEKFSDCDSLSWEKR